MQRDLGIGLNELDTLLKTALAEDVGAGDITSELVIPESLNTEMTFTARESLITCGLPVVIRLFEQHAKGAVHTTSLHDDGTKVSAGEKLLTVSGNARIILKLERTALNILQHLSGIASITRKYVDAVEGTQARILDTRKTLPGLRLLQKYAVRIGGGTNHRLRLDNGIMIKDNHIQVAGSIAAAVTAARSNAATWIKGNLDTSSPAMFPFLQKASGHILIEVECDTLEQVDEALAANADIILLDNMKPVQLKNAVQRVKGRAILEASGGITLENIRTIAETGVDFISIGALTHSVKAADIGLDA